VSCGALLTQQCCYPSQAEEKELFRTYVEDFNTSTLPHRKFYNLEFYHREKAAKARKKGHSDEVRTSHWLTQMHTCHDRQVVVASGALCQVCCGQ